MTYVFDSFPVPRGQSAHLLPSNRSSLAVWGLDGNP